MVVPSYPPGSMPAQISAAATAVGGGGAPHHMTTVPPHLMGEAPRGPMQPQQYLQSVYQAVAMGHHPQQVGRFRLVWSLCSLSFAQLVLSAYRCHRAPCRQQKPPDVYHGAEKI